MEVDSLKVRLITVSEMMANNKPVPQIRLQGKWLDKLGFKAGRKVIVEEKFGQVLIRLVNIEED